MKNKEKKKIKKQIVELREEIRENYEEMGAKLLAVTTDFDNYLVQIHDSIVEDEE